MPNFEINTDNAVLLKMQPGKPGSAQSEQRVTQKAQKGITCAYYAMNWIRDRQGKGVSIADPKRQVEKLISSSRKKLTALDEVQNLEKAVVLSIQNCKLQNPDYASPDATIRYPTLTAEQQQVIRGLAEAYASEQGWKLNSNSKNIETQLQMLFNVENLLDFLQQRHQQQIIDFFYEVNLSYGIDIKNYTPEYRINIENLRKDVQQDLQKDAKAAKAADQYIHDHYFEALSKAYQGYILHECAVYKEAELYGLKQAQFNFTDGIDGIMNILKQKGAITVYGTIGKAYYKPDSERPKQIGTRSFYAFPANSYSTEYAREGHVIVVLGASRKGYEGTTQDLIYYLDPNDESKPDQPLRIYLMSFKSFEKRVSAQGNFWLDSGKIKQTQSDYLFNPNHCVAEAELAQSSAPENKKQQGWLNCKSLTFFTLSTAVAATAATYNYMCRP